MSPEIVSKQPYFGPPTDIWAAGVMFYKMLCGTFPFRGLIDKDLFKRILRGKVIFPEYVSKSA
jgi:serine/threonine protein kinase